MKKLFTKWLLAAALASSFWQVNAQVNLLNGLVSYYPFNGNALDSSSNKNNGTTIVGTSFGTDRFGNPRKALLLNGGSIGGVTTARSFGFTNAYSLSTWIKIEPLPANVKQQFYVIGSEDNPVWGPWSFSVTDDSTGTFTYSFGFANSGQYWQPGLYYSESKRYNQWIHLVATLGNNQMQLFVDGQLLQTQTATSANLGQYNQTVTIGYDRWRELQGTEIVFNGLIDDFYAYNRVLSNQEVAALYTPAPSNSSTTTSNINSTIEISNGLAAYYPFAGNLNDISGNNWNGTITGTATYSLDRNGISGNALSLDGNTFVNTVFPGIPGTQARTVNLWVKPQNYNSSNYPVFVNYGPSAAIGQGANYYKGMRFGININNQQNISVDIGDGAVSYAYSTNLYDNNWHMLTYVIPANSQLSDIQIYEDCQLLTTPSWSCCFDTPSNLIINTDTNRLDGAYKVNIGTLANQLNSSNNYTGLIDDIRIYGRTLNQQEICTLKNAYEIISVNTVTVTSIKTVTVTSTVIVYDCSTVTGINSAVRSASNISVFPNPSSTSISVVSNSGTPVNSVSVFNSQGILVLTTSYFSTIDVSSWAKGLYLLEAKDEDGNVLKTFKILKE